MLNDPEIIFGPGIISLSPMINARSEAVRVCLQRWSLELSPEGKTDEECRDLLVRWLMRLVVLEGTRSIGLLESNFWNRVLNSQSTFSPSQLVRMAWTEGINQKRVSARNLAAKNLGKLSYLGGSFLMELKEDSHIDSFLVESVELVQGLNLGELKLVVFSLEVGAKDSRVQKVEAGWDGISISKKNYIRFSGAGKSACEALASSYRKYEMKRPASTLLESKFHISEAHALNIDLTRTSLCLTLLELDGAKARFPSDLNVFENTDDIAPEGPMVEYKSSFEWSTSRHEKSGDIRLGTLRTIAAFLNSQGGELYIGINDKGEPIGLDFDLSSSDPKPFDAFEGRIREAIKNHLDPLPLNLVSITFIEPWDIPACLISVKPRPEVTYLIRKDPSSGQPLEEIYVRDGNRTLNLKGRDRDHFVLSRARQS